MHKTLTIIVIFLFCYTNSKADDGKFVINSSKAVSELELGDMKDAWEIIRIDYPRAKSVFMSSSNHVEFCLFDLNEDNKFLIFSSTSNTQVIKFTVDGVDQPKAIQQCFMKLSSGNAKNADAVTNLRYFGRIFELEEEKACELKIEDNINSGKYLISLSKKIDTEQKKLMPEVTKGWSWWEGSVVITLKPIGIPNK